MNTKYWVMIIVGLGIAIFVQQLIILDAGDRVDMYQDDYEYKCEYGTTRECVPNNKEISLCDKGEYNMCYDSDIEYARVCNKLEYSDVFCLQKDKSYNYCDGDEYNICIDKNTEYTTCGSGESAVCVRDGVYEIWNGQYTRECNIGQYAYCQSDT